MKAFLAAALAIELALSGATVLAMPKTANAAEPQPPDLVAIAVGSSSTCALLSDASVACWGYNGPDGLGIGTPYGSVIPQIADLDQPATQITVGDGHACALVEDGTLRCWGRNSSGQIGTQALGSPVLEPTAVPGIDHVVSAAAGVLHTCVVRDDGTAWCWGNGGNGQLGAPELWDRTPPTQVPGISDAIAVAAGEYHTCLLLEDRSVSCFGYWGAGEDGQHARHYAPTPIEGFEDVTALSGGGDFTCGLIADGTVRCFGSNWLGQLGDGTRIDRDSAVPVHGLLDVTTVGAAGLHACAATAADEVFCWGANIEGQLGHPPSGDGVQPLPELAAAVAGVTAIDGGFGFTCGIASGTGTCWGLNAQGQLGDRTVASRTNPEPISWVQDTTLPTAAAPTIEIRSPRYLHYDGLSFSARITVPADDGVDGTGIDHIEARFSKDGGAAWGPIKWHWRQTWKKWFEAGETLTMQVRAVDGVGNAGEWITSPPLTGLLEQETASDITYVGNWQVGTNDVFSGRHSAYTTADGASATIAFAGRSFGLVSRMGKARGKFRVLVDGEAVGVVDLYAAGKRFQMVVYARSWAASGEHTVRIVALGTAGRPRVDLDAFVVIQ